MTVDTWKREEKMNSRILKRSKSSINEEMICPIKNKWRGKIAENSVDNKVSYKAIVLHYISVLTRKEGQYCFTKDKEEIAKGLKNLTLLVINFALTKVWKPLLKGFVHQAELVVANLKWLPNKWEYKFIKRLKEIRERRKVLAKLQGLGYESSTPFYFNIKNERLWYISVEKLKDK